MAKQGAKLNKAKQEAFTKSVIKNAAHVAIAKGKIDEILETKAKTKSREILQYLSNRLETEGDDFTRISGYGQLNEAIVGIYTGAISSAKELEEFKVFNNIVYWKKGDVSVPQRLNINVEVQVKGNSGSFTIPKGAKLFLDSHGKLDMKKYKQENLRNIFEMYFLTSITDTRVAVPIYQSATTGFFDFGQETFFKLIREVPEAFSFEAPSGYGIFKKTTKELMKEIRSGKISGLFNPKFPQVQKELEELFKKSFNSAEAKFDTYLEALIEDLRMGLLYRYGKIRFRYLKLSPRIAREVNPLINTGIERWEDHTPFYRLLDAMYGTSRQGESLGTYLSKELPTYENKMSKNYYTHTYASINY